MTFFLLDTVVRPVTAISAREVVLGAGGVDNVIAVSPGGKCSDIDETTNAAGRHRLLISVGSFYLIHYCPVIRHRHPRFRRHARTSDPLQATRLKQTDLSAVLVWLGNLHGQLVSRSFPNHRVSVIRSALPIDGEIIILSQIMAFPSRFQPPCVRAQSRRHRRPVPRPPVSRCCRSAVHLDHRDGAFISIKLACRGPDVGLRVFARPGSQFRKLR